MKRSLRSYPKNRNDLALICVYLFRHNMYLIIVGKDLHLT